MIFIEFGLVTKNIKMAPTFFLIFTDYLKKSKTAAKKFFGITKI